MNQRPSFYDQGQVDLRGPKGDKGDIGPQGPTGPRGLDGNYQLANAEERITATEDGLVVVSARVDEQTIIQASATQALARRVLSIEADYTSTGYVSSAVNAAVNREASARASAIEAEAAERVSLAATLRTETGQKVAAGVLTETNARVTAMGAQASRLDTLEASYAPGGSIQAKINASVSTETAARVTAFDAAVTRLDHLEASYLPGGSIPQAITAAVATETAARVSATDAAASRLDTLEASYAPTGAIQDRIDASVLTETNARTSAVAGEASQRTALAAALRGETDTKITAGVNSERDARITAVAGEAAARDTLAAALRTETDSKVSASQLTELNARVAADKAQVDRLNAIEASYITTGAATTLVNAKVSDEASARATAIAGEASSRTSLAATLRAEADSKVAAEASLRSAAISDQAAIRVAAEGATASRVNIVESKLNGATDSAIAASVRDAVSTSAQAVGAVSSRLSQVEASYVNEDHLQGTVLAYANSVLNTAANATGALSSRVDQVSATANGASSSAGINAQAIAGLQGLAQSRLQLLAVAGNNRAQITLHADANGGAGVDIVGDVTFKSRIIHDNGVIMKVAGVGFGTSNQFIEWVGPSKASPDQCSEADAVQYIKTNGSAYFGGSLSAGILKNAASSTTTAPDALIGIGPLHTNGNAKTIVYSFLYDRSFRCNPRTGTTSGTATATVILETGSDAGGWAELSRFNASGQGSVAVDGEPGVPDIVSLSYGASSTFVHNSGASDFLQYRARIIARNVGVINGSNVTQDTTRQTVSIISTE